MYFRKYIVFDNEIDNIKQKVDMDEPDHWKLHQYTSYRSQPFFTQIRPEKIGPDLDPNCMTL